jgi:hypothetical protein
MALNWDILNAARTDFIKNFGEDGFTEVKTDFLNGTEVIIVENMSKQAIYSVEIQLIKVINLKGEP